MAPIRSRTLPFPRLIVGYARNAAFLWIALRVALLLLGIALRDMAGSNESLADMAQRVFSSQSSRDPVSAIPIASVVTLLNWLDHRRSLENSFHASMGARVWIAAAATFSFVVFLEFFV